ncbi:hypothetical protein IC582_025787 [Cucumis melo]
MSRRGYANLTEDMVIKNVIVFYKYILKFNYGVLNDIRKKGSFEEQNFGRANMWKKAQTKKDGGYINEDVQQVANEIDEILDKAPNEESPNDALTQALGTPEYGGRVRGEKVLENVVKEKKGIATSVPPVSLTSKKKVVEEDEVKEEEVIATTSMTKNEVNVKVKSSRLMTKEVEVTSEPSNLPIQLKYILRYAERVMVDGSSFSFQLPLELFGISRKSYVLREDVIDFCNMQKVKILSMVVYITDHWSLVIINSYDDVVYHLDSLRTSSRDDIKYVTNMALTIFQSQKNLKKTRKTTFWKAIKVGYYVMRYMREILSKDTSIITDAIDTRNSYSQLELDEVRVEWAKFLSRYI